MILFLSVLITFVVLYMIPDIRRTWQDVNKPHERSERKKVIIRNGIYTYNKYKKLIELRTLKGG